MNIHEGNRVKGKWVTLEWVFPLYNSIQTLPSVLFWSECQKKNIPGIHLKGKYLWSDNSPLYTTVDSHCKHN